MPCRGGGESSTAVGAVEERAAGHILLCAVMVQWQCRGLAGICSSTAMQAPAESEAGTFAATCCMPTSWFSCAGIAACWAPRLRCCPRRPCSPFSTAVGFHLASNPGSQAGGLGCGALAEKVGWVAQGVLRHKMVQGANHHCRPLEPSPPCSFLGKSGRGAVAGPACHREQEGDKSRGASGHPVGLQVGGPACPVMQLGQAEPLAMGG